MGTPFLGEIKIISWNFPPKGWALANGQFLPINQNQALFSLLGTQYGGNGTTTFQLPNLASRAPCNQGQGPGLTPRSIGETFGTSSVTLTTGEMPSHPHALQLYAQNTPTSRGSVPASGNAVSNPGASSPFALAGTAVGFNPTTIGPTGGNQPHENTQPYLGLNFSIALQGIFPSFP